MRDGRAGSARPPETAVPPRGRAGGAELGPADPAGISETDAAEADIIEQTLTPSFDDEEDYREGHGEMG